MAALKSIKLAHKIIEPSIRSDKKDIILLHGISGCKENFDDVVNDLADKTGRRLYALDARNHGDSEWSDVFNFEAMTADVINFMDERNIKSAILLGHSMGGRLAMIIALKHPDRVEKIIVEDMTPKAVPCSIIDGYAEVIRIMEESIDTIPPNTDSTKILPILFENFMRNKPEGIYENPKIIEGKELYLPITQKDGKYVWKTNTKVIRKEINGLDICTNLEGVCSKPALFVYGTLSEFKVKNDEEFILKLFPQAQFHGLETSHNVHYECSEEYIEAVIKFLE